MRELNLDQLRTLVTIVDLGTFSAAANALHLAQPTVSLHISELEARLGVSIVIRGGRRVLPTATGAVLVERARRLLRDADDTLDAIKRHVEGRIGRVRLGTSTGVVVNLLPRVLKEMERAFPEIDVEVNILGSSETMTRLAQGTLDIGLVATPLPAPRELVVTHWRSDPMVAYLPADWTAPKKISPQWLADKPLIFNDSTTQMYRITMEWFAAAGINPRARIELNFTEAMKSLVAAGYGTAILPLEHTAKVELSRVSGVKIVPLAPTLLRHTSVAHRTPFATAGAIQNVLKTISLFRQL
ncbi:LysR family transcriptional regulator [Noviherbaspirillum saxi]|uniref:LysR family transcriptional regulator n=1 Tax=Noviherbaspirillum saxi TaxID=2320863 RepID=A0A3A3FIN1_9BURK|nr:LysR family transcriptional regulator [Noviherbaspirillum saxi]RJF95348.1 LysR family transcriptional regulator [Noviherbaspirillum saxi]